MQSKARIIFAGSPDFAAHTLKALLASRHDVVAVLTQPDRPVGRGRKVQYGPVKETAMAAGLPVLQPSSLSGEDEQRALADLQPDLMVVVAYGLLLPESVLNIPRVACVNVHASLLPRWRGASPIQTAVLAGDSETGISIMKMDVGLDTGPVYCRETLQIQPHETADQLHDRLADLGGKLLADNLDPILEGELQAVPQPLAGVSYAGKIRKSDSVIDWAVSAVELDQFIRAYNSWPVAQTTLAGAQLRCWMGRVDAGVRDTGFVPGTITSISEKGIHVQTGDGILLLTEVQSPGRKRVPAADFAKSRTLEHIELGL
jgi:methionyl-tRNA formyltransferase